MHAYELRELLDESLAASAHVYTAHVEDADAYITEGKSDLLSSLVVPRRVIARVTSVFAHSGMTVAEVSGWSVAYSSQDHRWLLHCLDDGLFHVAWGIEPDALDHAGFVSDDALAIWLL